MKGNSTSMEASQRIVLRVRRDGPIHGTAAKRPTRPVVEEAHESMVDLSVEGIQVKLPCPLGYTVGGLRQFDHFACSVLSMRPGLLVKQLHCQCVERFL